MPENEYEKFRLTTIIEIKNKKIIKIDSVFSTNTNYRHFPCAIYTFYEVELILLLQNRFVELIQILPLNNLKLRNTEEEREIENKVVVTCYDYFEIYNDSLRRYLNSQFKLQEKEILENINSSSALIQEEKDFLNYFVYFKLYKQNEYLCDDQIKSIELAEEFEKKYSNSKYSTFTNNFSNTYTESSDAGFGYRFGLGGFHNSKIFKEYFKQSISAEIGFILTFNRVNLDFSAGISNLKNQKELNILQTLYAKNRSFLNTQKTALIGYRFYLGDKVSFIPLIGSTHFFINFSPTDEEIEEEIEIPTFNFFSFQKGFIFEFDLENRFSCDIFNTRKIRLKDYAFSLYLKVLHTNVNFNKNGFNYIGKSFSINSGISFYIQSLRTKKIPI
jgi:hypothetical protein